MRLTIQWVADIQNRERTTVYIENGPAVLVLKMVEDIICASRWILAKPSGIVTEPVDLTTYLSRLKQNNQISLQQQGTVFFQQVWAALLNIPPGQTLSYGALAKTLNTSPRAIAMACRRNPFPGIIPCHRVVATSGIGGFMGQTEGKWVTLKKSLLAYEAKLANN
jgi:methylated-DNA-[protein]-cysteine S-methyltransferase